MKKTKMNEQKLKAVGRFGSPLQVVYYVYCLRFLHSGISCAYLLQVQSEGIRDSNLTRLDTVETGDCDTAEMHPTEIRAHWVRLRLHFSVDMDMEFAQHGGRIERVIFVIPCNSDMFFMVFSKSAST